MNVQNVEANKAKVEAENKINAMVNEIAPEFHKLAESFLNQQVKLKSGNTAKKVRDKFNELCDKFRQSHKLNTIYIEISEYSMRLNVTICYSIGKYTEYSKHWQYLGNIKEGLLTEIKDFSMLKTDYNYEEIERAQIEIDALEKRIDELEKITRIMR